MEQPSEETSEGAPAPADDAPAKPPPLDLRRGALRVVLSILGFFVFMAVLAKLAGPRIEGAGQVFVDRFGFAGLALGTVAADAFSLPPPPLFYIVIVATGAGSHVPGMAVICVTSMISGVIGYKVAALLSNRRFFKRRIDKTRERMDPLFERYGVWAFAIASATPIPFSWMCYVAGAYKLRMRLLALICVFRVPRLLVMYWLVVAGWVTGSG